MSEIVIKQFALGCQVCVPADMPDEEIVRRAEVEYPCGTQNGWMIRSDPKLLAGAPVRNPCSNGDGKVHVMLDA